MSVPMCWNPKDIIVYAEEHSIKECAEKYDCTYSAMKSYLRRHKIKHIEKRPKGKQNAQYKHGSSATRLYKIWSNMKSRCNNSSIYDYKYYGGRGIKICKEWVDFTSFKDWAVQNGYAKNLTLDRIDVNGNYCPSNCRWVTRKVQSNNKRNLHLLEYKGNVKTLTQWSSILDLPISTLYRWLKTEKSIENVIDKLNKERHICVVL